MSQATQSTQPETTENQSGHQATRGYLTSKDDYLKRLEQAEPLPLSDDSSDD